MFHRVAALSFISNTVLNPNPSHDGALNAMDLCGLGSNCKKPEERFQRRSKV